MCVHVCVHVCVRVCVWAGVRVRGCVRLGAALHLQVEVDDIILAVNGIKSATLTHPEVVTLLHNAGDRFVLKVANEAEYRESIVVKKGKGAMSKLLSKVTTGSTDLPSSSSPSSSSSTAAAAAAAAAASPSKRSLRHAPAFATKPPPVGLAASDNRSDPNSGRGGGSYNTSYNTSANNSNNNSNIPTNGAGPAIMPTTTSGTMLSNDGGGGGEDGASTNEERAALFAQLLRVPLPATYECIGVSRGGAKPGSCAVHREATIEAEKIGLFWSVLKLETPHELRICWRSIVS